MLVTPDDKLDGVIEHPFRHTLLRPVLDSIEISSAQIVIKCSTRSQPQNLPILMHK